jgi:hypothetical protein
LAKAAAIASRHGSGMNDGADCGPVRPAEDIGKKARFYTVGDRNGEGLRRVLTRFIDHANQFVSPRGRLIDLFSDTKLDLPPITGNKTPATAVPKRRHHRLHETPRHSFS